jgi:hypothetical protein
MYAKLYWKCSIEINQLMVTAQHQGTQKQLFTRVTSHSVFVTRFIRQWTRLSSLPTTLYAPEQPQRSIWRRASKWHCLEHKNPDIIIVHTLEMHLVLWYYKTYLLKLTGPLIQLIVSNIDDAEVQ